MADAVEDERLVRFARLIAHGMRNPLAIATGMLDLLDRQVGDDLDDELRDLLRRSSEAIRRAGDQLLVLQRYTGAARDGLDVEELDLAEVVGDVLLGIDAGDARVEVAPDLPEVVADRRSVERALREVVANALVHAGDDGGATIAISARDEDDAVVLVVDDDGPGIPPEQRPLALVEGERLGRTGDGFGLGLAIVRILLRRHGGSVELDGSPAGGLRVSMRWPRDPALLGEEGAQR